MAVQHGDLDADFHTQPCQSGFATQENPWPDLQGTLGALGLV